MLHTVRTGQTAIAKREGVANCFNYFARNPASFEVFNAAMSGYATYVDAAIIDAYDFSAARCVVDIGGGTGTLLGAILASTAEARGVLFDKPQVIAGARPLLEAFGTAPRCDCIAGDFFSDTEEEYVALLGSANFRRERVIPTTMPVSILEERPH